MKRWSAAPTSTFYDLLCKAHLSLWCTKWSLLINYRIQAHWSSQRTLVMIQLLSCSGTDAQHQPALG
jgi:hypothetical protein